MPTFTAKPIQVEAVEYCGLVSDLPPAFALVCSQAEDGAAYLRTPQGTRVVQPGEWLVKGREGIAPMSAGVFEASFEKVPDPEPDRTIEGGVDFVFNGVAGDPDKLRWMGHEFPRGCAVFVTDPAVIAKLRGNRQFSVVEPEQRDVPPSSELYTVVRRPGRPIRVDA